MTGELWVWLRALVLLGVANGAPLIGTRLLGKRFGGPLDRGLRFFDRRPLFGPSKTVRGAVLSFVATTAVAPLLDLAWQNGAAIAGAAMAGDIFSSFTKRRLGMAPSSMALGLDQVPESLLPLLVCRTALGIGYGEVAALVAAFTVLELAVSRVLYWAHVRDRPY